VGNLPDQSWENAAQVNATLDALSGRDDDIAEKFLETPVRLTSVLPNNRIAFRAAMVLTPSKGLRFLRSFLVILDHELCERLVAARMT
jgi:hypothetical protein